MKSKNKIVKTEPDEQELEKINNYLAQKYPDNKIRFLWNIDNVYRFRLNRFIDSRLEQSQFVVVTVRGRRISHVVKNGNGNEKK